MFQACVFRWLSANKGFSNRVSISIENAKLQFSGNNIIETKAFIRKLNGTLEKINKKTNIYASYEKVYDGKKLVKLEFHILDRFTEKSSLGGVLQ